MQRVTRQKSKSCRLTIRSIAALQKLQNSYGLSRQNLVQMLGVSKATLAKWLRGTATPDAANRQKSKRVGKILWRLGHVMKKNFVATWLSSPNDACEGRMPM